MRVEVVPVLEIPTVCGCTATSSSEEAGHGQLWPLCPGLLTVHHEWTRAGQTGRVFFLASVCVCVCVFVRVCACTCVTLGGGGGTPLDLAEPAEESELRSCVKIEVDVLGSRP